MYLCRYLSSSSSGQALSCFLTLHTCSENTYHLSLKVQQMITLLSLLHNNQSSHVHVLKLKQIAILIMELQQIVKRVKIACTTLKLVIISPITLT